MTGAAAEKIYRSLGPDANLRIKLDVATGATLAWLPQETILFDRARIDRSIDVDLAADARLILAEAVIFGRTGMGERVVQVHGNAGYQAPLVPDRATDEKRQSRIRGMHIFNRPYP